MSGIPAFNVPAFTAAAKKLREKGHTVISPPEADEADGVIGVADSPDGDMAPITAKFGETWGSLIARDKKIIADDGIEAIAVLPGWLTSKGARLEVMLGIMLNLDIFEIEDGVVLPKQVVAALIAMSFKEVR